MSIPDELISPEPFAPEGERVRGRWARRLLAGSVALGLVAGGVGTAAFTVRGAHDAAAVAAAAGAPRAVNPNEAYRLSVMRVQNYRLKGTHFRATVPTAAGLARVDGDVDFRRGIGFAKVSGAGAASGVYQWTPTRVVTWSAKGSRLGRPVELPDRPARTRALAPRSYAIDAVLTQLLALGGAARDLTVSRDAHYLRTAMLSGTGGVDVIAGARRADGSVSTYFVDNRAVLHRVTTNVGARRASTVTLNARAFHPFPRAAELRPVGKAAKAR